ncbi:alpha/beta hydrolase family protein [Acidocella facilis]|uniref:hypothetical protein n=1 Tax=Acidocella facilis TaxID=525 RepID=UPI00047E495A|nr:hypothetical protein [Acidocella facilis]
MASPLPDQDYIYASEIAYLSDPKASVAQFLPHYEIAASQTLDNGFQAIALRASDGHYLIAFRGTLPDYKGTLNRFFSAYGAQVSLANTPLPSKRQIEQAQEAEAALQADPMIQDLSADFDIFSGKRVAQFQSGLAFVTNIAGIAKGKPIYITGHSLGGGIANFVAGALPGKIGATFAAPGYKLYGAASAAAMVNYYNVNDSIPTVNLRYHCGACKALDILHSSFAVETELRLRRQIIYGFNGTPDATTAMTAHADKAAQIVLSSFGFLLARLIYHQLPNYAGWLNCKSITGRTTKYTIHDFANAAAPIITHLLWLQRQANNPIHGLLTYEMRMFRRGERFFVNVFTAYGQAEIDMGAYGAGFGP